MTLVDLVGTLLFLLALVYLLVLVGRAAVQLARGRTAQAVRTARRLALLLAAYALVLLTVGLVTPRRFRAVGERECFDDWCVSAQGVAPGAPGTGACRGSVWLASLEVASEAKRVHQRAADATALLEDSQGDRYFPCGPPLAPGGRLHTLRDRLGPGESFPVVLPFALPAGRVPAGVVVRHGYFPGLLIVGADWAVGHRPTLLRLGLAWRRAAASGRSTPARASPG